MKQEGWKPAGSEEARQGRGQQTGRPAPGKVTRTSKLPGSRAPVVQRKAAAGAPAGPPGQARSRWELTTDPWMDAAHRGLTALAEHGPAAVQARGNVAAGEPGSIHAAAAAGVSETGSALPHLDRIQTAFGAHAVSHVRAHVGGQARQASEHMGAEAYATGDHVAFRSQPDLHTAAHEAAHVVQQRAGVQLTNGVGQAGDTYERQADAVADAVVAGGSAEALLGQSSGSASSPGSAVSMVQRTEQPGAPYEEGHRPDPSSSSNGIYELTSSSNRVLRRGEIVTYQIRQVQDTIRSADSTVTTRWEVINDPAAAATGGVQARLQGPANAWSWQLHAAMPGVHTIRAEVQVGTSSPSMLEYRQAVVPNENTYADIGAAAPSPLATIADFIALVERIESAYAGWAWQDVASRIRKEYYPGVGGREGGIQAAFTWDDLIDEQQDIPPLQSPPVAAADIAALRSTAVVTTAGGSVDIGHVLTGLDSMNFPRVAGIFDMHDTSGPAAATWSGDVGSALVRFASDAPLGDDSDQTRQTFYNRFASVADMLGDYDGIAVADVAGVPASAPLSERLRRYYVSSTDQGVNRRYHNFCAASAFTVVNGRLDAAARGYIRTQIERFASAFNIRGSVTDALLLGGPGMGDMSMGMGAPMPPADIELTTAHRISRNLDWFVNHFITQVEAGLAGEG
ncbi:MAG TPA: DUF4157 domain-containing protein [Haliangium sp.]|nr:DUF4157 domain-containing protein [Haliangium sp.]